MSSITLFIGRYYIFYLVIKNINSDRCSGESNIIIILLIHSPFVFYYLDLNFYFVLDFLLWDNFLLSDCFLLLFFLSLSRGFFVAPIECCCILETIKTFYFVFIVWYFLTSSSFHWETSLQRRQRHLQFSFGRFPLIYFHSRKSFSQPTIFAAVIDTVNKSDDSFAKLHWIFPITKHIAFMFHWSNFEEDINFRIVLH